MVGKASLKLLGFKPFRKKAKKLPQFTEHQDTQAHPLFGLSANSNNQEQRLNLTDEDIGSSALPAWFLGPKAENQELFQYFIKMAVDSHCDFRRRYYPQDPKYVTREVKASPAYNESVEQLHSHYELLLKELQGSLPLSSYRNQSHMYWDITMPSMMGYFAGMMYNQNNVAAEASPVTTHLEMQVGDDLCRMLGYQIPSAEEIEAGAIRPWGHITCGGSVANLESQWAARNLKYYPISIVEALKNEADLAVAKEMQVELLTGEKRPLLELDTWQLLNLKGDVVLALTGRLEEEYGIGNAVLNQALDKYTLQNLGFLEFQQRYLTGIATPRIFSSVTSHYSWPKSSTILGLGKNCVELIQVDLHGRMNIDILRQKLAQCLAEKRPVIQVVAIMGTTEGSSVDPLKEILNLREKFRQLGLEFELHLDAAWGGYFASILRERSDDAAELHEYTASICMSEYVAEQLAC